MRAGLRAAELRAPLLSLRGPECRFRSSERGRGRAALGAGPLHGQLLRPARVPRHHRAGEDRAGRHGGQMRQQRVQQQEAETPDHVHERAAGGAGEGVPEDALSRCVREGAAGHEDGVDGGQGAGVVSEPTGEVEEKRALRSDPTSQKPLRSHLRFIGVTEERQLHADPQQPVAGPRGPRRLRGLLVHAAARLSSVRHVLRALPALGRRRSSGPRLHGLPEPAEPVRPRVPQQLLRRGLAAVSARRRPARLRDQTGVRAALVQHRGAAHEGQRARGQHLLGHVMQTPTKTGTHPL